jgi:hypothetical protein
MKRVPAHDFERIFAQDLPDLEKMRQGFDWVISMYLAESQREQEVLRALGDRETLVKEQIKASTLRHARQIFNDCYFRATGRSAWNDEN